MYLMFSVSTFVSVTSITFGNLHNTGFQVSWAVLNEGCGSSPVYRVEYMLTNKEQCQSSNDRTTRDGNTGATSVRLTNLLSYSTYQVFITPVVGGRDGTTVMSSDVMTSEAGEYHILRSRCRFIMTRFKIATLYYFEEIIDVSHIQI